MRLCSSGALKSLMLINELIELDGSDDLDKCEELRLRAGARTT